ncbi:Chromosome partition protein Smc [Gammaproteobacteria bacterium]
MRLEKIKLSGFKSFVDPTTVPLATALVGVVGPNGCGKSNVIDAIRWVMGESSAKMLRGESMADVIFNGSTSRKPVSLATVELVFDNADGSAGGAYACFAQISVKRQVSRDGQSNYFLNGARCRRRDITDLFLGTGLGPRSYSIIEQGTISRLIEARPEELRGFLEEAAGISRYKERRKETETRIRATRENLDRLNDLREEVHKQLAHLERQAATAERYRQWRQTERQLTTELRVLRWRGLDRELAELERTLGALSLGIEEALTRQRSLEAALEIQRERHAVAGDHLHAVQGQYYAVGAEISRFESAIQFARESQSQRIQEQDKLNRSLTELEALRIQDQARAEAIATELDRLRPQWADLEAEQQTQALAIAEQEAAQAAWQSEWDQFHQRAALPAQTAQVERTRINHLEQQEAQLLRRLTRLREDQARLEDPRLELEIESLEERLALQEDDLEQAEAALSEAQAAIQAARQDQQGLSGQLDKIRRQVQTLTGGLASLKALQVAATGSDEPNTRRWLADQGFDTDAPRLSQQLRLDPQWERAAEAVLGQRLGAVLVDRLEEWAEAVDQLPSGSLGLMATGSMATTPGDLSEIPPDSLARFAQGPATALALLAPFRAVPDVASALVSDPVTPWVTPTGLQGGPGWLWRETPKNPQESLLGREREIQRVDAERASAEARIETLEGLWEAARENLEAAEEARDAAQEQTSRGHRELSQIRSQLQGARTRQEHWHQRQAGWLREAGEIEAQRQQDQEAVTAARHRLHQALEQMGDFATEREALAARREEWVAGLAERRESHRTLRQQAHQVALRIESLIATQTELAQGLFRSGEQVLALRKGLQDLAAAQAEAIDPLAQLEARLSETLHAQIAAEQALKQARGDLEQIDGQLRGLDQDRQRAERLVLERRGERDTRRLHQQELRVRAETLVEQLDQTPSEPGISSEASQPDWRALATSLPEDAQVNEWEERLAGLAERIQRLGSINLAAIDEYQEQAQRARYLEAQHNDISQSLLTLEEAIRKIDQETRTRFQDTFERVNEGLKILFPRLFGGGHATLELTGDNLLEAGVTIMARPPGKRNSSIHLLSGGEKALTAVALVFAIFELNPAPFCLLDEVDAPLDDANVGRFCELLKSLSNRVQFIFITHNKITMEAADRLMGVTMSEPGVSRLVSVDVEEAVTLVTAGG